MIKKVIEKYLNKKFNKLTVKEYIPSTETPIGRREAQVVCICECGNQTTTMARNVISGHTKSCGCLQIESVRKLGLSNATHGLTGTVEYTAWFSMRNRCFNSSYIEYHQYGGRGIMVCKRWMVSFEEFHADVGDRPSLKHSIDRINNDGHYSCGKCKDCLENGWPMNVRWATAKEQQRNKQNNRIILFNGKSMTLVDWAEELNMPYGTLWARLNRGKSVEEAFLKIR